MNPEEIVKSEPQRECGHRFTHFLEKAFVNRVNRRICTDQDVEAIWDKVMIEKA